MHFYALYECNRICELFIWCSKYSCVTWQWQKTDHVLTGCWFSCLTNLLNLTMIYDQVWWYGISHALCQCDIVPQVWWYGISHALCQCDMVPCWEYTPDTYAHCWITPSSSSRINIDESRIKRHWIKTPVQLWKMEDISERMNILLMSGWSVVLEIRDPGK